MTPHWSERYLGLPLLTGVRDVNQGVDCWGLLRHIYLKEFGQMLRMHPVQLGHLADQETVTSAELSGTLWKEVSDPQDGDGVAIGKDGTFSHVGVYVQLDEPSVIHSARKSLSCIVTVKHFQKQGFNFIKFYRHDSRRTA